MVYARKQLIKQRKKKTSPEIPDPTDKQIEFLSRMLYEQSKDAARSNKYASVKQVLALAGLGAFIGASFLMPGVTLAAKPFLDENRRKEREEWKQYNPCYLKRTLQRLRSQKIVDIHENDEGSTVVITTEGRRKILRFALDQMQINRPTSWDGKWRLVMYDVSDHKKQLREIFRNALKNLGFYQLQESVWIYPYRCDEQITFLREYYGVGNEVVYIAAQRIEDDSPFRTYFGV